MAETTDATPETMPPTSAPGGESTDSAPLAPRAKPPRAEPRMSPKPFFCAGGVLAAGVMTGVSIPSSSPRGGDDPGGARSRTVPRCCAGKADEGLRPAGRSAHEAGRTGTEGLRPGSCPTAGPPSHSLPPVMPELPDLDSIRERQHPRVAANLPVEVKAPGLLRQAVAEDISLAGLRGLGLRAPTGQSLLVALALPGDRRLQLRCSVVRQDETGVALEFDGLDWEDLFALARFLHPRL